jgi:hypothetical protein
MAEWDVTYGLVKIYGLVEGNAASVFRVEDCFKSHHPTIKVGVKNHSEMTVRYY